jgi:hypothetical protein
MCASLLPPSRIKQQGKATRQSNKAKQQGKATRQQPGKKDSTHQPVFEREHRTS